MFDYVKQDIMEYKEARASAAFGARLAGKLNPLHTGEVFRFPHATREYRDRYGLEDAVGYALRNATVGAASRSDALAWVKSL